MPGLKIVYLTIHDYYFVVDNFRLLHFLHPFLMHVNFFPFVRFELRYPIIYSRENFVIPIAFIIFVSFSYTRLDFLSDQILHA